MLLKNLRNFQYEIETQNFSISNVPSSTKIGLGKKLIEIKLPLQ